MMVPDPLPLANAVYAFINVDNCELPLNTILDRTIPDVPRRLALSNFEHLVSLSSEHRTHRQTDS